MKLLISVNVDFTIYLSTLFRGKERASKLNVFNVQRNPYLLLYFLRHVVSFCERTWKYVSLVFLFASICSILQVCSGRRVCSISKKCSPKDVASLPGYKFGMPI